MQDGLEPGGWGACRVPELSAVISEEPQRGPCGQVSGRTLQRGEQQAVRGQAPQRPALRPQDSWRAAGDRLLTDALGVDVMGEGSSAPSREHPSAGGWPKSLSRGAATFPAWPPEEAHQRRLLGEGSEL